MPGAVAGATMMARELLGEETEEGDREAGGPETGPASVGL